MLYKLIYNPFIVFFSANCKTSIPLLHLCGGGELETSLLFVDQDIFSNSLLGLCIYNLLLVFTKEGWKLSNKVHQWATILRFLPTLWYLHSLLCSFEDLLSQLHQQQWSPLCYASVVRLTLSLSLPTAHYIHSLQAHRLQRKGDHLHAFPLVDIFELLGIFILSQKYWNIRTPVSLWVSRCPRPTTFIHIKPTVCREREITFNLAKNFTSTHRREKRIVFRVSFWSTPLYNPEF